MLIHKLKSRPSYVDWLLSITEGFDLLVLIPCQENVHRKEFKSMKYFQRYQLYDIL